MTDYHPVTKEELDLIKNDCVFPERTDCEECKFVDMELGCGWKGANVLMEEVIARPDPLEVLEKYIGAKHMTSSGCDGHRLWIWSEPILEMINEIRTNPDAVIARGKEEGWLK